MQQKIMWRSIYQQLCCDFNCKISDFLKNTIVVVPLTHHEKQRQYYQKDCPVRSIVLATGGVIAVEEPLYPAVWEMFHDMPARFLYNVDNMAEMAHLLHRHGIRITDLHHVFLPERVAPVVDSTLEIVELDAASAAQICKKYNFAYALSTNLCHPNKVVLAAFDKGALLGMAAASEDAPELWQIGADVLPEARGKGVATALVRTLRTRVESNGKVPYLGARTSHVVSQKLAISSGFSPAWVELYTQPRK